jgi:hypothetical protein
MTTKRAQKKPPAAEKATGEERPTAAATGAGHGRRNVDHLLIPALVAGLTIPSAAERAGCSVTTVERRLRDPEFVVALTEARNDLVDRLLGQTLHSAVAATNFLFRVVMGDEPAAMHHRIRAAIALRSGVERLDAHVGGAVR